MAIQITERCRVAPASGAAAEQVVPLLHFDIVWLRFHPMENLIFYTFPCSESHFFHTIVPNLKSSLSLTLKHFLPLAGNLIFPLTSATPASHYAAAAEDSISLAVALSSADLRRLTANHAKNADDLRDLVPHIPAAQHSADSIKFSAAAVQVTLFPNQGISIGLTSHHAACDGASLLRFLHAWAFITKSNCSDADLPPKFLPSYDRSGVPGADRLAGIAWSYVKTGRPAVSPAASPAAGKLRATFTLTESNVKALKKMVLINRPKLGEISSFAAVTAQVWSCLAKAAAAAGEEVADEEMEFLSCAADCRARLSPPLADSYFGNCLAMVVTEVSHGRLRGRWGMVDAAEAMAEAVGRIKEGGGGGVLEGFEKRLKEKMKLVGRRVVKVAGSPRFDLYGADFGWGEMTKFEALHIDFDGAVSLCRSRDGGVEIGLSMPKPKMDAFTFLFQQNVNVI